MSQMLAFVLVVGILFIGDLIATRTKAWVPSVFVCAVLFLVGYWTFFPKDIVAVAGFPTQVAILAMYLLVANMGTLLSVPELVRQWKTVVIALAGVGGIIALGFAVGSMLFDTNTVLVAIPPLTGGIVSSSIMSQAASKAGIPHLAVFATLIYVVQGFAGYPLTAVMLKKEGQRVLKKYRAGEWSANQKASADSEKLQDELNETPRMFSFLPGRYNTDYFKYLRLGVVCFAAYGTSVLFAKIGLTVNAFVVCLVYGVLASTFGFLERHPLHKGNAFGFMVMALMLFIFDTLKLATPEMIEGLVPPLAVFIACAIVGMYITSFVVGRILGVSTAMGYAISLTALYGFPADYIITIEAVNGLTADTKERQVLLDHMLAPMLVGGFVSVTIVSVIIAGVFSEMVK